MIPHALLLACYTDSADSLEVVHGLTASWSLDGPAQPTLLGLGAQARLPQDFADVAATSLKATMIRLGATTGVVEIVVGGIDQDSAEFVFGGVGRVVGAALAQRTQRVPEETLTQELENWRSEWPTH